MKTYKINGREYKFFVENFTRKDFLDLMAARSIDDEFKFNEICDRIFENMLGSDVILHMPMIDFPMAVFIMQREVMESIANKVSAEEVNQSSVELVESEEDEISQFLKRFF